MEVRTDNSNEEVLGKVLEEVPTKQGPHQGPYQGPQLGPLFSYEKSVGTLARTLARDLFAWDPARALEGPGEKVPAKVVAKGPTVTVRVVRVVTR